VTELLPWAYLGALAILVGLGVIRDRALSLISTRIEAQLQRLEEQTTSLRSWFQETSVRLGVAEKDAREALLKHTELHGRVTSIESWRDTHTHRTHSRHPLTGEDP
jgi:hypothetical protein